MIDSAYADYDRIPGIRWTTLQEMAKSPAHYVTRVKNLTQRKETKGQRIGRAIHCLLLEGRTAFEHRWAFYEGDRRRVAYKEFVSTHEGYEILTGKEMRIVQGAVAGLLRHALVRKYLHGAREKTVVWVDKPTGLQCKARPDLLTDKLLLDVKSTNDLSEFRFSKAAERMGYHCQMAHYLDGLVATGWRGAAEPVLLGVETSEPFDVVPFHMPLSVVSAGRRIVRRLLDRVAECERLDEWPGRSPSTFACLDSSREWGFSGMYDDLSDLDMSGLERE